MVYSRIRELRIDHDLTQYQLSQILYLSQKTYSQYETGKRKIPVGILSALAEFYHRNTLFQLVG
ncbi:helix-turn-helix domain-containing protein [Christensenella tenuis]|jgi:transcriptional regulator with XRE-family HTH domain|uniref:Helix-turn-helix transcriptional regulator n=1 Tax=Christensenella tenuis TaxID=2763033 RepID=A0ABR7EHN5_9FIRM|nr:helix-turn-helix transcriptional regulator [Christensenella tenuis]MBC5649271.1 helix-turn-helix transcriptional regulator [Christensenella tenuis]